MENGSHIDQFYRNQNAYYRQKIKELDWQFNHQFVGDASNSTGSNEINLLIVGPNNSGKSCFQKTLAKSLQQHPNRQPNPQNQHISTKKILSNTMVLKSQTIKKSKSIKSVNGLTKVKNIRQQALQIYTHEITQLNIQNTNHPYHYEDKYGFLLCLLQQNLFFRYCTGTLSNCSNRQRTPLIDGVAICLSMTSKVCRNQVKALRNFIYGLQDSKIPYWIIGTGVDKLETMSILPKIQYMPKSSRHKYVDSNKNKKISLYPKASQNNMSVSKSLLKYSQQTEKFQKPDIDSQYETLKHIEQWKKYLANKLQISNQNQIYCIQNYCQSLCSSSYVKSPYSIQRNQIIEFYALKILSSMTDEIMPRKKQYTSNTYSCCWNL